MRMNVDKVLERDSKLSQLDDRAGNIKKFVFTKGLFKIFNIQPQLFLLNNISEYFESNGTFLISKDALQMGASQFEQSAGALKRKFWWKNLKVSHFLETSMHTDEVMFGMFFRNN